MNVEVASSFYSSSGVKTFNPEKTRKYHSLLELIRQELAEEVGFISTSVQRVSQRMTTEVERVCQKSKRIQNSGQIQAWRVSLARHRLRKCLHYYQLDSQSGRVELHSNLSVIVYRYIAPTQAQLGFQARRNLLEDFLQDFYTESLKAFRRENEVSANYQPRTRLELAEYMAFTEQYGKRRITLPNGSSQQLIILRAQTFARRLPKETTIDINQAGEYGRDEETEGKTYSATMQQVRSRLVSEMGDPAEAVLRDRVIKALFEYLESQGHADCADYLALKLQDLPATEIDEMLNLTSRQRDYLQQRFKYHVEKFSRSSHWRLVHQWLGADLDEKLGMTNSQWQEFVEQLSPEQRQILAGRQAQESDEEIAKKLKLTPKNLHKQWTQALELAAKIRNQP
jgi:hypothetical protein